MITLSTADFDNTPDRRALPGLKWGKYAGRDILPMWVADMDFAVAPAIQEALRQRIEHPVFGYVKPWPSLIDATIEGIARHHQWHVEPSWLVWLPGVVPGFNLACQLAGKEQDAVFFPTPAYPPFFSAPGNQNRQPQHCPLEIIDGLWQWNRAATEATINAQTRLFLLCNPHNPTGRVFTAGELEWIAQLCQRHDLILCSDEIHAGLVLEDERTPHQCIANLIPEIAHRTITLMAPSKTWNIAGLQSAFAIIPDRALRQHFIATMQGLIDTTPNLLGLVAAEAAWRHGSDWLDALKIILRRNCKQVQQAVAAMPGCHMLAPEATFLAWIDCRKTGLANPAAHFEQAGAGLSDGADFGAPGFVRLNFACNQSLLGEALDRMRRAL